MIRQIFVPHPMLVSRQGYMAPDSHFFGLNSLYPDCGSYSVVATCKEALFYLPAKPTAGLDLGNGSKFLEAHLDVFRAKISS